MRRAGYRTAALVALVGVVVSVAWGVADYQQLQDRLAALPRAGVPGEVTVEVAEPRELTVYVEDPTADGGFVVRTGERHVLPDPPVDLTVTGPAGEALVLTPYEQDLRFHTGGRVAVAVASFEAESPGSYVVAVDGEMPANAQVSVGDVVDTALVANVVGAVVVFVGSTLTALVLVALTAVRRSRPPAGAEADRPRAAV